MTRVANLAQFNSSLAHILDTQRRIQDGQTSISSGRKSPDFAGIARESGRLVSTETAFLRANQFRENNDMVNSRLQTMEANVAQLFDVASGFLTTLVNGLNADNAIDLALPDTARIKLEQVAGLLNVQQDGRFLFAGSRTDVKPVDTASLPGSYIIPTVDGASAAYYQGDNVRFAVRADEAFDVSYGVTANEPAFEKLVRALHIVQTGAPGDRATLEHALAVLSEALDMIPDIRTKIGSSRATLEEINNKHEDFLLYSEETISNIENVDIAAAVTRLNADQVTLEASYLTISRLTGLNLMQFLR